MFGSDRHAQLGFALLEAGDVLLSILFLECRVGHGPDSFY
jgi:hypothetical protein